MTPILYKSDEIDFTNNGLGQLNELYSVDIQEQRNGLLTFTGSYPVTGQHYSDIQEGRIILAKPSPLDDNHAFRIVNTQLDISGYAVQIEADSITYDLTHNIVKSVVMQGDGQNAMKTLQNAVLNPSIFTFYSDITATGFSELNFVNPMEAIAGIEGSFLQKWGGELKRENRRVSMFNRRGRDNVATFRLGKNISGLKYTVDTANLVTQIIPTVTITEGDASRYIEGTPVSSKRIGNYPVKYMQHVDLSDVVKVNDGDSDDTIRKNINSAAVSWFTQSENTGKDLPQVTVEVDVLSLQDSADYSDKFAKLETIGLTDTVTVYVPEYGVNVTAIVNELHYDPIGERVTSLVVGTAKVSFADANKSSLSDLMNKVTQVQEQVSNAVVSANGKNSIYTGRTRPTHAQEGDTWFWEDGENSGIRVFKNGEWVDVVDSKTLERITNEVKNAIDTATAYADNLNSEQAEATLKLSQELATKVEELSKSQESIVNAANNYTDAAVADANAKATAIGQTTAQNAQKALDEKATTLQQSIDNKVAKTDYDKKTGELTTSVNTAQQTANTATQTIGTYKQTNDQRVSAAEANIKANSDAIALTASKTDLDKATGELSGSIGDLQVKSNSITQTVSDLQTKVNNLGQTNLLNNTDFNPDLEGWTRTSSGDVGAPYRSYLQSDINGVVIGFNTTSATTTSYSKFRQTITLASTTSSGNKISLSWSAFAQQTDNYNNLWVKFYDTNGTEVSNAYTNWADTSTGNTWKTRKKWENITIPDTAVSALVSFEAREGTRAYLGQPMAVYGATIGDYVAGNYNNNASLAEVKVKADGVYQTVNDPKTGLNTRVSTAEGNINTIKNNVDGMSNTVTETADGLTREISDRQTGDNNTLQAGKDFTTSQIKSYDTGMQSQIGQMSDGILATVSTTNLVVDSSLLNGVDNWEVLSGDRKWYYTGLTMYKGVASMGINVSDSSGSYNRINSKPISTGSFSGNTVYVSVDVLARSIGTSSTDYLIVYVYEQDSNGKNINSTMVTGQLTAANDSWVNYRKKITLNSNTKSLYMNYQLRGNGNVYVSRPYVGNVELPAGGYIPGSNNNNSTVLALLKDNWRIGIADNVGLITSGIVADANSITQISKNVTIDSPNTQIKGTAWITTAMIGDGQIGTAKIGDLAVTSAKISELDVNKLSGNITNFIKSYWSNAYQNLQIDASAIDFTTSSSRTKIENGSITMWQNAGGYYRLGGLKAMKSSAGGENNHTAGIYLALDEWQTTKNGDKYWNYGGSDFFGGSEIGILHSTGVDSSGNPQYGALMKWSNPLAASRTDGLTKGFNFYDDINFQGHNILVNGAANKMKFTWISWSDWGNYHNIALTNETSKAGIAMNNDNLVLFGSGKRADATTGWNA